MDWWTAVDIYCERTATGLLNEPLNALSNGAFLIAAYYGYRTAHRLDRLTWPVWVAVLLVASIGIGSSLFHTFANQWSELTDVIPIWTFVVWMVLVSIYGMSGGNIGRAAIGALKIFGVIGLVFWLVSGVIMTGPSASALTASLNGSEQYAPALIALYIFAVATLWQKHPSGRWFGAAAAMFTLALMFRTVDIAVCTPFPYGTHWVWHLLNGAMIGLLLQALIRHLVRSPDANSMSQ